MSTALGDLGKLGEHGRRRLRLFLAKSSGEVTLYGHRLLQTTRTTPYGVPAVANLGGACAAVTTSSRSISPQADLPVQKR